MNNLVYMKRALYLAKKGAGYTSTNPMVGSVIVHNNRVIGEGYHHKCGEAHAEVNAINSISESDKQYLSESTMFVTLEPCCHYGKTPPCTSLIIENKIPRVVVAMQDPFAKVAGGGIEILRNNGIDVTVGVMEEEAKYLNRRFITYHTKSRPYVILKWAETLDGYIDSDRVASAPSLKVTNSTIKTLVHRWRAEEDAIMVGTNTVLRDNPSLTVRNWFGNNPIRVTIDRCGKFSKMEKIFNSEAETICYKNEGIEDILSDLYSKGVQSIFIEGGAKLLQAFIDTNYFDEIRLLKSNLTLKDIDNKAKGGVKAPVLNSVTLLSKRDVGNCQIFTFEN